MPQHGSCCDEVVIAESESDGGQRLNFLFVLAVGLVFLEVGLTEDRERAREERAREADRQAAARKQAEPRRRSPRPLERMRGSRRRLR